MKSTLLTKAALCICPPAIVATTAATVPPVRRAVHHLTRSYEPHKPVVPKGPPCVPLQHKTFAATPPVGTVADDVPQVVAMTASTPQGPGQYVPPGPLNPPSIVPPQVLPPPGTPAGVPEPAAWMTMVLGFGLIGAGVRQRRRQLVRGRRLAMAGGEGGGSARKAGSLLGGGGVFGIAGLLSAGTAPVRAGTQMGSKALHSSMLAKAAMCVCPPVAMAVGTAAIPPVRHAVYNATAPAVPKQPPVRNAVVNEAVPCVPVDVPTAAEAVRQGGDELAAFKPAAGFPG